MVPGLPGSVRGSGGMSVQGYWADLASSRFKNLPDDTIAVLSGLHRDPAITRLPMVHLTGENFMLGVDSGGGNAHGVCRPHYATFVRRTCQQRFN